MRRQQSEPDDGKTESICHVIRYVCTHSACDFTTTDLAAAKCHIGTERWHWVERQRPVDLVGFLAVHDDMRDAFYRIRAFVGKAAR